jgi:GNAT superfamily N-acetyltransferase
VLDVTIRQAVADDAEAIAGLIGLVDPDLLVSEISPAERRERFHELLAAGRNVVFLAEAGGAAVGELTFALGHPNPTAIGFSVHPAWRRRGVARQLLEHGLAWADEQRARTIAKYRARREVARIEQGTRVELARDDEHALRVASAHDRVGHVEREQRA